ncbi:MAG: hypothetical protein E6X17_10735 [Sporomusaceae bacterium]|nr:hypothetical protein [Sporomusaceae bacterium]
MFLRLTVSSNLRKEGSLILNEGYLLLKKRILEFLAYSVLVALVLLAPFVDILILENGVTEISLTEFLQEIMLTIITGVFCYLFFRYREIRYGMLLIAGFFACLLIRELDFITDMSLLLSWFHFVVLVAGGCIFFAFKHKDNALRGLGHFCQGESCCMMLCGLLAVLVFSRLFGMNILWEHLLTDSYLRIVKNAIEEVTELFGYTLCLIASCKYWHCAYAAFKTGKAAGKR